MSAATKMPAPIRRGGQLPTYPWATMKVGDYFFVPHREKNTMGSLAWSTGKKLGRSFSTRLCWMRDVRGKWVMCDETIGGSNKGAVLGVGIWRIA